MNIDDLTIGEAKKLADMFGDKSPAPQSPHIGKKCIVRTYASGVHFGTVLSVNGRTVELAYARRLWRWDVAPHGVSLSEVALYGPVGDRSKICETIPEMSVLDALEVIPCTDDAVGVIKAAKVYKP